MSRPTRFEHNQFVGDKRTQVVHDIDRCSPEIIDELMEARTYISFGPDTLVEAANRCYKPHAACAGAPAE